jgi:hypothetical protein
MEHRFLLTDLTAPAAIDTKFPNHLGGCDLSDL